MFANRVKKVRDKSTQDFATPDNSMGDSLLAICDLITAASNGTVTAAIFLIDPKTGKLSLGAGTGISSKTTLVLGDITIAPNAPPPVPGPIDSNSPFAPYLESTKIHGPVLLWLHPATKSLSPCRRAALPGSPPGRWGSFFKIINSKLVLTMMTRTG